MGQNQPILTLIGSKKGQATTELAIMGSIVLLLFAYLLQKGYLYNARQALEMYTFRAALKQSARYDRDRDIFPRGIILNVYRDVMIPSFFTGLNRVRLQAAASVDFNPYMMWTPDADSPQDLPTIQLLQIGEAMIRNETFIQVPPTRVRIATAGESDGEEVWINSSISQILTLTEPAAPDDPRITREDFAGAKISEYSNVTTVVETPHEKEITKDFSSRDTVPTIIRFATAEQIVEDYLREEEWKDEGDPTRITNVEVLEIPSDINLVLRETVQRSRTTTTPH